MGRYELTVTGEFAAAHRLRMYDGAYEPLHGHNWRVEALYEAVELDRIGVAADFTELRRQVQAAAAGLHDRYLNEIPRLAELNPSAENVARLMYETLAPQAPSGVRLRRVRVWETSDCAAAYEEP